MGKRVVQSSEKSPIATQQAFNRLLGPGLQGEVTLQDLVVRLVVEGVYMGQSPERTIRFYQSKGLIPKPRRVKNPRGRGMIALYPARTVEIIRDLRRSQDLIESRARYSKTVLERDTHLDQFEQALDEWYKNHITWIKDNLAAEKREQWVLDIDRELSSSTARFLPHQLLVRWYAIRHMTLDELNAIGLKIWKMSFPTPSSSSEWTDPNLGWIHGALDSFGDAYSLLTKGRVVEAYGDLRATMYIAWFAQRHLEETYRKKNES